MIKYPDKVSKDKLIGITATSLGITSDDYLQRLKNTYKNLDILGYKYIETANVRTNRKFASSDGKTRAEQFMDLWKNDNIDLISQLCGGEFLMDMLPYIDKNVINSCNPKWVTGYSDSSLLNYVLTTNFNIATATTSNIIHFCMTPLHKSLLKQFEILENRGESVQESFDLYEGEKFPQEIRAYAPYNLTDKVEYKNLYNESSVKFEGRLIGGCIDVLVHLLGTPFDNTVNFCKQFDEGILWYLENCELSVLELYRVLWQMKQSGWFKNSNGFIIGRTWSSETIEDYEYIDALHNAFDSLDVPVIYDVDFGHVSPQWTMINGAYAEFEYENGKGKIIQKMI